MPDILIRGASVSDLQGEVIEIGYDAADCLYAFVNGGATDILEAIELPEHGEWIEDRMDYRCSVCGKTVKDEIIYMLEPYQFPAFCPYCGVKLEPPKEETE